MPILLLGAAGLLGLGAVISAYFIFPHFQIRIHQFLASGGELSYQVKNRSKLFKAGSLFGRGPGEGNRSFRHPRCPYRLHLCGRCRRIRRRFPVPEHYCTLYRNCDSNHDYLLQRQ